MPKDNDCFLTTCARCGHKFKVSFVQVVYNDIPKYCDSCKLDNQFKKALKNG